MPGGGRGPQTVPQSPALTDSQQQFPGHGEGRTSVYGCGGRVCGFVCVQIYTDTQENIVLVVITLKEFHCLKQTL